MPPRPEGPDFESRTIHSSTPKSQRLSYEQEGRGDVAEMNEKLKDAGFSDEELAGRNPFYADPESPDFTCPPEKAEESSEPVLTEREIQGMTTEEARQNPKMLLDQIERLITAFENNEIIRLENKDHFFQEAQAKLIASMVLASRIKESVYKSGLKERQANLRSRYEKLNFSS